MDIKVLKVNGSKNATLLIEGNKVTVPFSNLSEVKQGDIIMTDTVIGVKVLKVKKYTTSEPFNGIDYDIFMTCEHYNEDIDYDRYFRFLKPNYKLLILNDYIKSKYTYNELLTKIELLEKELQAIKNNKKVS